MKNEAKNHLTLMRGNQFPGGAMNTEVVRAKAANLTAAKSILGIALDKVKNLYAKIWGPSEIETVILRSIENDHWTCTFDESIKHIHFERKGFNISLATTKVSYGSWKGWSIYKINLHGVDVKVNDKRILRYIVDFKLPNEVISWGFASDSQMLNAVRKTLE